MRKTRETFSYLTQAIITYLYFYLIVIVAPVLGQPGDLVDPDYTYLKDGFHDEHILYTKSEGHMDLNFMPDNKGLLINEKDGRIKYYSDFQNYNSNNENGSFKKIVLDISDKVCDNSERGLHTTTLHPNFENNGYLYLYYTYAKYNNCNEQGPVNVFSRFTYDFDANEIDPNSEKILIETMSAYRIYHNGGGVAFGSDGYIYIAIGDCGYKKENVTLTPSNLLGSILRITDDGSIPAENPYAKHPNSVRCALIGGKSNSLEIPCQEVYAVGVRNPFNLAMNPFDTKEMDVHFYFNDVGANSWEEINEGGSLFKGVSYGWQYKEGPCVHKVKNGKYVCHVIEEYKDPIHWYTHGQEHDISVSRAVVGSTFVPPDAGWPEEYDGSYIFIEYRLGIYHLKKRRNNSGVVEEDRTVFPPISNYEAVPLRMWDRGIRMKFGPCDSCGENKVALYYLTREPYDELRRLTYIGNDMNRSPVVSLYIKLEKGGTGLSISLDGSNSHDPDGEKGDFNDLTFSWDFGDNSPTVFTNNVPSTTYQYIVKGTYEVSLTVTDKLGKSSTAAKSINVGIAKLNELVNFEWQPKENDNDCLKDGYDYCGVMEFCYQKTDGDNGARDIYGYRLPCKYKDTHCGETCKPGPGPVIRMEAGKRYKLTLSNTAPSDHHPTNLHTHGLHIVGAGDSDDVTRIVDGGYCLDYTWDIPDDHTDGTYWYHPHHHGTSETQVSGGAFGLIIIENNINLHKNTIPKWTYNERLLQIFRRDDVVLGNGNFQEPIYMDAEQWYRLRVSVVDPNGEAQLLEFGEGCEVHNVASDGIWHSTVPFQSSKKTSRFELTGASRADFAVRCYGASSSAGGESTVSIMFADEIVALIHVEESTGNPFELTAWSPALPGSLQDIAKAVVSDENKFDVEIGRATINGLEWNADVPLKSISYDTVHEWNLSDSRDHPFHTHLYHMMVVTPGGCGAHREGEFYDTIAGPPCTIRFKTADIGQRFVFHCHVLSHGDSGSMGWVDVQGPGMPLNNAESQQYVCRPSPPPPSTPSPTLAPTTVPTLLLTPFPTELPTPNPTQLPKPNPTPQPTQNQTLPPTAMPTPSPTLSPTLLPTQFPTPNSSPQPTLNPTRKPTPSPPTPTLSPTKAPVLVLPTFQPSISPMTSYPETLTGSPSHSLSKLSNETGIDSNISISPTKSPTECLPMTLIISPYVIQAGRKHILVYDNFDLYLKQNFNGNLVVRQGHPDDQIKQDIIWDSNIFVEDGNYFSVLSMFGELSTFKGTPENVEKKIWSTNFIGSEDDYFFALTCNRTVAVYKGLPENSNISVVWPKFETSELFAPSSSPTLDFSKQPVSSTIGTVSNSTVTPTNTPIDTPTDPTSSTGTINPTGLPAPATRYPTIMPTGDPTYFPTSDIISLIECQGDCNSDDDCEGDLVCFHLDESKGINDLSCDTVITRAYRSVCYSPINVSPLPTLSPSPETSTAAAVSNAPHQTCVTFAITILLLVLCRQAF